MLLTVCGHVTRHRHGISSVRDIAHALRAAGLHVHTATYLFQRREMKRLIFFVGLCSILTVGCDMRGRDGVAGPAGADGRSGVSGADGTSGAKGDDGKSGADGATGQNGATGQSGANGAAGADGAKGDRGRTGDR